MAEEGAPARRARLARDVDEAAALEASLFGAEASVRRVLESEAETREGEGRGAASSDDEGDEAGDGARAGACTGGRSGPAAAGRGAVRRAAAWHDPADEEVHVSLAHGSNRLKKLRRAEGEDEVDGSALQERLRRQHSELNPRTRWAQRMMEEASRDTEGSGPASALDGVLRDGGALVGGADGRLPRGTLELSRLRDANAASRPDAAMQRIGWHPSGSLLLTASLDRRVRFFAADGGEAPLVQSLYLEDLPVRDAAFCAGGAKVLATGRRRHFYVLDLEGARAERVPGLPGRPEGSLEGFASSRDGDLVAFHGNEGTVPLFSLKSRALVGELQMAGGHRASAFLPDGNTLLTSGTDGVVHTWDLRTRRCLSRARDEGAVRGTSLAVTDGGELVAAGSDAGVVNLYRGADLGIPGASSGSSLSAPAYAAPPYAAPTRPSNPAPLRTLMHLTTRVDSMAFAPGGEILAFASRMKKDQLKLLHVESGTIFSNWPSSRTPLGHVQDLAFSPTAAFLAVANAKGRVLLYRLHHYAPTLA